MNSLTTKAMQGVPICLENLLSIQRWIYLNLKHDSYGWDLTYCWHCFWLCCKLFWNDLKNQHYQNSANNVKKSPAKSFSISVSRKICSSNQFCSQKVSWFLFMTKEEGECWQLDVMTCQVCSHQQRSPVSCCNVNTTYTPW